MSGCTLNFLEFSTRWKQTIQQETGIPKYNGLYLNLLKDYTYLTLFTNDLKLNKSQIHN